MPAFTKMKTFYASSTDCLLDSVKVCVNGAKDIIEVSLGLGECTVGQYTYSWMYPNNNECT